jgi:hypothetical protein
MARRTVMMRVVVAAVPAGARHAAATQSSEGRGDRVGGI